MSIWKGGMKFVARENGKNPEETLLRSRFVHHDTHIEWPRRELGTPAMGSERLKPLASQSRQLKKSLRHINQTLQDNWLKEECVSKMKSLRETFQKLEMSPSASSPPPPLMWDIWYETSRLPIYNINIQVVRKFLLQTSRACRGDCVDNF